MTSQIHRDAALRGWENRRARADEPCTCPECGTLRRNTETLRAHRGIAHGIES